MTAKSKTEIKAFFETGDRPTQAQFTDLIDSYIDKSGPLGTLETLGSGASTGPMIFTAGVPSVPTYSQFLASLGVSAMYASTAQGVAGASDGTIMTPVVTRNAIETIAFTTADYASTAQANAGTNATTVMSPVLVKNAINTLGSVPTGGVVNTISYAYTTNGPTGTTALPIDDTIPQITEGNQVFDQSYTMSSTANKLRVEFRGEVAGTQLRVGAALFVNGASNAVRSSITTPLSATEAQAIYLLYEFTPGTISAQQYEIRIGRNAGGDVRLNGTSSASLFGGTMAATLTFTEIKV